VHQIFGEAVEARAKAARARSLAARTTKRERQHVEIIASAIEGQPKAALAAAEQHLDEFPRDALVLSILLGAFGLYAFSGRVDHDAARVAICERHARHYGQDWWFLTYLGWSHTEAGNHGAGRTITELALSLRRENGNAAHALSHALYEQGDTAAGRTFLADWLPTYDPAGFLNGHLSWHFALLALGSDEVDKALEIYQERIRPTVSGQPPLPPLNVFTDSASLLWRLSLAGKAGLEPHWRDVANYSDRMFPRAGVHFADVHWALVSVATQSADFDQRLAELETLQASGKLAPGQLVIELCRGIRAFANGDYEATILAFEPLMPLITKIGGSHAQRDLYEDTYIVACLRSGRPDKARLIIDRRLDHRASTNEPWLRQANSIPS
jgi:tetratricopeptide (TPR) repeat protein